MNKLSEYAQREQRRRAACWADKVSNYLQADGPNSERILEILERARERRQGGSPYPPGDIKIN